MKEQMRMNKLNATLTACATQEPMQPASNKEGTPMKNKPRLNALFVALALLALPAVGLAQSDSSLSNLVSSAGTLAPTFASGTLSYTATVPYSTTITGITVTATLTDTNASFSVSKGAATFTATNGLPCSPIPLNVGANVIDITVYSANYSTTTAYTLTVTCLPPSSNADLSNLVPSAGTLAPAFDSNT
jgi:hypothetical protein